MRDADALGADPFAAFRASTRACADAFDGAPGRLLDYPRGRVTVAQALAIPTAETVVHTSGLARALGGDEELDHELVRWIDGEFDAIYAGLDGVLHRMGR
jgi:hypothetical protein